MLIVRCGKLPPAATIDSLKVAILAALHIADEYHQLKRQFEQTDAQLASAVPTAPSY